MLEELRRIGERLAQGAETLRALRDVVPGATARTPLHRVGKAVLYRFGAQRHDAPPLLMVTPLVNRWHMTDLQENRSTVRGLVEAGQPVYLIDWGYPDRDDRALGLDHYISHALDEFVDHLREVHRTPAVNLLGVCQGGTFGICYAALYPHKVRNLVPMVTPVDFHTPNDVLSKWVRHVDVDALVGAFGNVPGPLLTWTFMQLNPLRQGQKYLDMLLRLDDAQQVESFLRMERWIHDCPDQAGAAFREFVKLLYQDNALVTGRLRIGERHVDPGAIGMPILNVYATRDHLVPPEASLALRRCVSSGDYHELAFEGGHIGIYVSERGVTRIPPAIGQWLGSR